MYNFKEYQKKPKEQDVRIQKSGSISIPRYVIDELSIDPVAMRCVLFYDAQAQAIGIKPIDKNDSMYLTSYCFSQTSKARLYRIATRRFFIANDIDPEKHWGVKEYTYEEVPKIGKIIIIKL